MSDCDDIQREVGEWAKSTFPQRSRGSIVAHLGRELSELIAAVGVANSVEDPAVRKSARALVAEEAADIFLLVADLAAHEGFSLITEARNKLAVCKTRQWAPADSEGVSEHVRIS